MGPNDVDGRVWTTSRGTSPLDCRNQHAHSVSDMRVSPLIALFIGDGTLACDLGNFDGHRLRYDRFDKEPVVHYVVVAFGSDNIISRRDRGLTRLRHGGDCKAAIGVMLCLKSRTSGLNTVSTGRVATWSTMEVTNFQLCFRTFETKALE